MSKSHRLLTHKRTTHQRKNNHKTIYKTQNTNLITDNAKYSEILLNQYLNIFTNKYKQHYAKYYKTNKTNKTRSRHITHKSISSHSRRRTSTRRSKTEHILDNAINLRLDNIYKYFEKHLAVNKELNKLSSKPMLNEYNQFIKNMLNKSLTVKNDKNTIARQINAVIYNGNPLVRNNIEIVPEGCIIVVLTPIGRYGIQITDLYKNLIKNLNKKEYDNFMSNPMCYKRNELHGIYSDASIYFPGQYYTDISLIYEDESENNMYHYWGFYKVDLNKDIHKQPLQGQIHRDVSMEKTTLSRLIKEHELKGVIFVHCCRSIILDHARYKDDEYLQHTVMMKRYETFIKTLNKCVFIAKSDTHTHHHTHHHHHSNNIILSDDDYENCDKITLFEPTISSKTKKPIDYYRKLSNTVEIAKYQKKIQPELDKLRERFTNANSETMAILVRIINGLKPLMNSKIIKYINAWLNKNNPAGTDIKHLFKVMHKYFSKIITSDEIQQFSGLVEFLKYGSKIQKLRKSGDNKLLNIIDIIMSYCIYSQIKGRVDSITNGFANIIYKLLGILRVGDDNLFNIFLNGLKLTVVDFKVVSMLFINISGNIYLRNNDLLGIPQSWIIKSSRDKQVVCAYKVLDITGNGNIDFHLAESDGVKLANMNFFKTNSKLIEMNNPEFMSYMSGLFDQLGLSLLDSK
jgi:hypothetical protein